MATYQAQIQQKYNKATEAYGAARAILDEQGDKPLAEEKSVEFDKAMAAFDGFVAEAKRFERMQEQERIVAELTTPQNDVDPPKGMPGKPGEGHSADDVALYMKAWTNALKGGRNNLSPAEAKALRADIDPSGGFLVAPQQVVTQLIQAVDDAVIIRRLATVFPLDRADSLGVPVLDTDLSDATWTSELKTGNEDTVDPFNRRELKPSPLAKKIKVSKKLLRQSTINVDNLVRSRLAYKFGVSQENGFMTGSGTNQPLGIFTASSLGISTGRDVTAANASSFSGDDFIDAKFKLKAAYWPKARWMFHRDVLKAARKLKDLNNNYLWSPGLGPGGGLSTGIPATLIDTPYEVSEFAPSTIMTGLYTAVIGDFSYYWIAEALNLEIHVVMELYAETNQVGYIGRMELDGMPVHEDAFARLKMA
jgi:HK97 family phage major capsid protein